MKRKTLYTVCFFAFAWVLLSACVTQKRKEDLKGVAKAYHNTTAKYNGYFNAREILEATLLEIEQQHQDNYQNRLVFFPYMAIKDPKQITPQMDKVIEKVTRVVALHPRSQWTDDCYVMVGKAQFLKKDYEAAEETLRFMVGEFDPERPANYKSKIGSGLKNDPRARAAAAAAKAKERQQIQKQRAKENKQKQKEREKAAKELAKKRKQYNKAVQQARKKGTTVKVPNPYAKPKPGAPEPAQELDPKKAAELAKKKAKEEEAKRKAEEKAQQPEKYFLKHKPAYQEGVLWLARTLIERDNNESAMRLLNRLLQNTKTLPEIKEQIWPVLAYLYIKREQPDEAVAPLEYAVAASGFSRMQKARYAFILAQLHETEGRWQQAGKAYSQAVALTPSYDMAFRARLNMALNNYRGQVETLANTRQNLEKMLRDEKNLDYKDQIYFTLANLALENKDREAAIENLRLALENSRNNPIQKAETYYTLAQLYIQSEEYLQGKLYLDSTIQSMPPQDERLAEIKRLQANLKDIAEYIVQIKEMDTLLQRSLLSDDERRKLASSIKKAEDEKRLAKLTEQQAPPAGLATSARREIGAPALNQADAQSTFFAYNERNLRRGERDFSLKWGSNRVLEDDWRRSNRRSGLDLTTTDSGSGGTTATQRPQDKAGDLLLTPEEVEQILGKVPKNEGERRLLEFKISEAMFRLGTLYQERLQNNRKSIDVLEAMQQRFPRNNFELETWYYLYLAYVNLGDQTNARLYADKLQDKYPSSKYALVIKDPSYLKELTDKETEISRYYERAYAAFQQERFEEALQMCNDSRPRFGAENPLRARFAMLTAFCAGKLQGKDAYVASLAEIIAKFPDTEEQRQAREILRLLSDDATASLPGGLREASASDLSGFAMQADQLYYILVAGDDKMNINDAKNAVSDFNRKYHKLEKLSLTNMFLGPDENNRTPLIIVRRFNNRSEAMKYYQSAVSNPAEFIPGTTFEVMAISLNNYRELIRQQSVDAYLLFFKKNYK